MAAASLLALLDDIALVLDDVALMTKVAAKKTSGVLGDDLALNAEQVSGIRAERELPVVWAVCKGSLLNKLILVPAALLVSFFAPWAVLPALMVGGLYLCFEGVEKLAHKLLHSADEDAAHERAVAQALADPQLDLVAFERDKIRGAVRTDFVLSAEIIVITLGVVASQTLAVKASVLAGIAVAMTFGVYGLVAAIVKLDDVGLWLSRRDGAASKAIGRVLLLAAPWLMKLLAIVGTIAMFLVGGGILVHGWPALHHLLSGWTQGLSGIAALVASMLGEALAGIVAGAIALAVVTLGQKLLARRNPA
ncbi:DUF808 domain-containing protein [Aquabacterium sp.]|uniref:DUF808 domain-containing protein n=1 Tax=Aquabacterium sp. TaxID=1872578 RepID=UPI0037851683